MTRLTIPKHHSIYLESIASQMGTSTNEALNFLLWELRKSNYQFGGHLQTQASVDPSTYEPATAMSALSFTPAFPDAVREFESTQELHQEIDPIIARMALLVDEF